SAAETGWVKARLCHARAARIKDAMVGDGRPVVVRRIASFLGGTPGVPVGSRLLVACSGGPDSTALAYGLAECAADHPVDLTLVHLRHGLRPRQDEDGDEAFVQQLGARLGSRVIVQSLDVPQGSNLEA